MRILLTPRLLPALCLLAVLPGCTGLRGFPSLVYLNADTNSYARPSLIFERIGHDASPPPSTAYFGWLHGPATMTPAPSEYQIASSAMAASPAPGSTSPTPVRQPLNPVPESAVPQNSVAPAPPAAPPIQIIVPPELTPPPLPRGQQEQFPSPPAESDARTLPPFDAPSAAVPGATIVQPAGYARRPSLPGSRVLFARP